MHRYKVCGRGKFGAYRRKPRIIKIYLRIGKDGGSARYLGKVRPAVVGIKSIPRLEGLWYSQVKMRLFRADVDRWMGKISRLPGCRMSSVCSRY